MDKELRQQQQQRVQLNLQKQRLRDQYFASQDANTQTFIGNQIRQMTTRSEPVRFDQSAQPVRPPREVTASKATVGPPRSRDLVPDGKVVLRAEVRLIEGELPAIPQRSRSHRGAQATESLARPWVMIGPQWEYDTHVRSLAQMVLNDAGLEASYTTVSKARR